MPTATVAALWAKHIVFGCNGPNPDGGAPDCVPGCEAFWGDCNGDFQQTVAAPTNPAFDGCEVFEYHNKDNCGACGKRCREVCHTKKGSGEQVCDCPDGQTWCESPPPGDCVDTQNDPHHCGSCGVSCFASWDGGNVPNGDPICVNGTCGFKCHADYADCNHQAADGCEVDTQNSPDHCGRCDRSCAKDQRCGDGRCLVKDCPVTGAK
jgi:hypothetical protein